MTGDKKVLASTLPRHDDASKLADQFSDFFEQKVLRIRERFTESDASVVESETNSHSLSDFEPMTEESVRELVQSMKTKSCDLDPIPTSLLKLCLDDVILSLTCLINQSLTSGEFPTVFKQAILRPLLKKAGLDINDLSNYRPVSNISFASKLCEKAVFTQLNNT
ncbi:hypothetical protein Pmani_000912 [Petrolisthes manimaculis]|uniref:Reverse transcriptase domain-containing protein n=1 Tax=Petrolisthes manimaculis TaxID=1843537 RepID=A0AAE1QNZ4_9EUCA|nr:hypothetical protein Pmani_000912 [Petrolisthes manimaculis]